MRAVLPSLLPSPLPQLRARSAENAGEWVQTLNAALEEMDAEAHAADGAVAEGEERLKWARMLVYETEQLEWVTCRLTLTPTTLVCVSVGSLGGCVLGVQVCVI